MTSNEVRVMLFGCSDTRVTEQQLDLPDIGTALEQLAGECIAEPVRAHVGESSGSADRLNDAPKVGRDRQHVSPPVPEEVIRVLAWGVAECIARLGGELDPERYASLHHTEPQMTSGCVECITAQHGSVGDPQPGVEQQQDESTGTPAREVVSDPVAGSEHGDNFTRFERQRGRGQIASGEVEALSGAFMQEFLADAPAEERADDNTLQALGAWLDLSIPREAIQRRRGDRGKLDAIREEREQVVQAYLVELQGADTEIFGSAGEQESGDGFAREHGRGGGPTRLFAALDLSDAGQGRRPVSGAERAAEALSVALGVEPDRTGAKRVAGALGFVGAGSQVAAVGVEHGCNLTAPWYTRWYTAARKVCMSLISLAKKPAGSLSTISHATQRKQTDKDLLFAPSAPNSAIERSMVRGVVHGRAE